VRNGILSLQKAHEEYGIVLDPMTMELKQTEAEQLRRKSKK
jgi:hypothetical protein